MLTLAAVLFGVLAYQELRVSLMPPLSYPSLTVLTSYPGAAPEEVEVEITSPLESRLSTLEGLISLRSRSLSGQSEITLSLKWETQLDRALQRVYERLDRVELPQEASTPQVLRYDPNLDPLMVLTLSSHQAVKDQEDSEEAQRTLAEMKRYALDVLTPSLYQIEGVAAVKVSGGDQPVIDVKVHLDSLQRYGLTIDDVSNALSAAQINQAGGLLHTERGAILIRTLSELKSIKDLQALVIKSASLGSSKNERSQDIYSEDFALIRLSDVAEVTRTYQERNSWVQMDHSPAVRVQVYRQSESDLVAVSKRIRQALFKVRHQSEREESDSKSVSRLGQVFEEAQGQSLESIEIPNMEGLRLRVISDQADFIERALTEVNRAILFGGLLAILILYAFLASWSQTLVIAVAMPLSVILAFIPLQLFEVSLNLMSLGGLALGVGMLVDNAVVVLESISRRRDLGEDPCVASERGVSEVGSAVFASTLTTVAVFAPVAFIDGLAGQIFRDLAFTVVSALIASLFVALLIVPTLSARLMREESANPSTETVSRRSPTLRVNLWPVWLTSWRQPGLIAKLKALASLPLMSLEGTLSIIAVSCLLGCGFCIRLLSLIFRPMINLIALPFRVIARATNMLYERSKRLYLSSLKASMAYPILTSFGALVLLWLSLIGQSEIPRSLLPEVAQGVVIAEIDYPVGTSLEGTKRRAKWWTRKLLQRSEVERVNVMIGQDQSDEQPGERRGPHQARLTISLKDPNEESALRRELRRLNTLAPGSSLKLSRPSLIHAESPLRIVAKSQSLEALALSEDILLKSLERHPNLSNIERTFGQGAPELKLVYDHDKLKHLGLTPREVASQVKSQLTGREALELIWEGERLPLQVRGIYADHLERDELLSLPIKSSSLPGSLYPLGAFVDLKPSEGPAEIRHVDGQRAAEITAEVSAFELAETANKLRSDLKQLSFPPGVDLESAGQERELQESASALSEVLLISLFLVFVVMATQFESLRAPLLIMGSVPLALIGVILGLWLTHTPMSIVVFVGMITLGGVVVNNAIVFVDAAKNIQAAHPRISVKEALLQAGERRLRPILMTTLTTLIGLAPMLSGEGEGSELRGPLALTLMFGLACSTLLVLFVLPSIYVLFMPQRYVEAASEV